MAKTLVIVESPAKARTIARYLGAGYTVKASMGHVRDLPKKGLGVDVANGFVPDYQVSPEKGKTVAGLRKAVREADRVLLATDPDREGEAIAWHIAAATGMPKRKIGRVAFHEITATAVRAAVASPRAIDMHLVDAQQARRVLDRLVGYKLSPVLWDKVQRGTSAGRVQSVALRLVVEREREIQSFVPAEYWTLEAELSKRPKGDPAHVFCAKLIKIGDAKADLPNEGSARAVVDALGGAAYKVAGVRTKRTSKHPAAPFTTSTLQQEASRKLGWGAKRAMAVAQQLYEGVAIAGEGNVGLITYMRTDSTAVSEEAQSEARAFIRGRWGERHLPPKAPRYATKAKNAQEAHEAIRPTATTRTPKGIRPHLTPEQDRLYTLIWRRFVASQMAPALIDQTAADIATGRAGRRLPYLFRATGSLIVFPGFLEVYREGMDDDKRDELDDKSLPPLAEQEPLDLLALLPEQHFTEPPRRYTEATLVKALEEKGIGRPSTYASIMSTIQDRGYVGKEGKTLLPTDLGRTVSDLLVAHFPDVVDIGFTSRIEDTLDGVASGKRQWVPVIADFYGPFEASLRAAQTSIGRAKPSERPAGEACPECGRGMVIKAGKFGEFLACSGYPECKHTRHIAVKVGVTCPGCGQGELVEKKAKGGKQAFYGCARYPECRFTVNDKPVAGACARCGGLRTDRGRGGVRCILCDPPRPFWQRSGGKAAGSTRPGPAKTPPKAGKGGAARRRGGRQGAL